MNDFASFQPSSKTEESKKVEEEIMNTAKKYDGKNETELMRDIYAKAKEGKMNGTVTNEQIDAFYAQIAPMLDRNKRKKLQRICLQLKEM